MHSRSSVVLAAMALSSAMAGVAIAGEGRTKQFESSAVTWADGTYHINSDEHPGERLLQRRDPSPPEWTEGSFVLDGFAQDVRNRFADECSGSDCRVRLTGTQEGTAGWILPSHVEWLPHKATTWRKADAQSAGR